MDTNIVRLPIEEIPRYWYNALPDLPGKGPVEGLSDTEMRERLFTKTAVNLDTSNRRWIRIPDEILEAYARIGRPTPLYRAKRLEKYLGTPARLYYKREDLSPTGAYKINTAIAQTYYAYREGYEKIVSETGAGNTGSAFSYASSLFGLKYKVFQVAHAYRLKKDRVTFMKMLGAEVSPSPSRETELGRRILKQDPESPGNIGIAIGEAVETVLKDETAIYGAGSYENHVLLHHTIIGLETKKQLELIDEKPDVLISCVGGGANLSGLILPFYRDMLEKKLEKVRVVAAESEGSARLTKGEYKTDFFEPEKLMAPRKVYTLGQDASLPEIRAEGLRGAAASPILSLLRNAGFVETVTYPVDEKEPFKAAALFFKKEGVLVAMESSYSVKAAIDEAKSAKEAGEEKTIVFSLSGNGFLDIPGYREVLGDEI